MKASLQRLAPPPTMTLDTPPNAPILKVGRMNLTTLSTRLLLLAPGLGWMLPG